jgi:ribokinase
LAGDTPAERGHVVVLGSVNVDLVVDVDRLPSAGETVTGGTFARHHGGKGANQAVAAARLGASVSFVGAVGDDAFGVESRASLGIESIDVSGLAVLNGAPTGVALIVVDEAGENQIAVASGANLAYDATIWNGRPEPQSSDVFLSGFEVSIDAVVSGAQRYAAAGALVVINPAPAMELPAGLLATRPILVPNEGEAQTLTGESDPVTAARVLAARSGAPVVVTLGPMGAVVVQDGEFVRIPAPLVEAVDATGAGDAFVGALAAELAVGRSLTEAVQFAVHAASLSVRAAGAREGMPKRSEVERSMTEAPR